MKSRDVKWIYRIFLGFIYGAIISGILFPSLDSSGLRASMVNRWMLGLTIFLGLDFFCRTRSWLIFESGESQSHLFEWLVLFELLGLMALALVARGFGDRCLSDAIKNVAPLYAAFCITAAISNLLGAHFEQPSVKQSLGYLKYFTDVICGNVANSWQLGGKWQKKAFELIKRGLNASEGFVKKKGRIPIVNLQIGNLGHVLGYSVRAVWRFYCQAYASHLVILNGFVGLLLLVRYKWPDISLPLGWPLRIFLSFTFICYLLNAHHEEESEFSPKRSIGQTIIDIIGNITFFAAVFNIYCYLKTDSLVKFMIWQQAIVAVLVITMSKGNEQANQKQSDKREPNEKRKEMGDAEVAPVS